MKVGVSLALIPLALLLISCGQNGSGNKDTIGATPVFQNDQQRTTSTNTNTNTTTSANTNTNTQSTSTSCSHTYISSPAKTFSISGIGPAKQNDAAVYANQELQAGIDQELKIQIIPGSASPSSNSGGTQSYRQMAADVSLYVDGVETATVTLPNGVGSVGPNKGLDVGSKSEIIDFSAYLKPGAKYKFRIKNVRTDNKCTNSCTFNYYYNAAVVAGPYICDYDYSACSTGLGSFDYYRGCCNHIDFNEVNRLWKACIDQQCDVGPANTTAGWSLQLRVQTDTTECL